jgi:radical SAM superfamily enzyme YgiQ (UPF0313 family)
VIESPARDGDLSPLPLFRLIVPRVPYPNVFSHILMPPLGVLHVATAVKRHGRWDVEVIDELNWRSHVTGRRLKADPVADHRDLQSRRPAQVVGFYGGLTSTVPRLFELAKYYRSMGLRTVAGGAHVDALPDEALREGIDIVVHGEGEETIIEILEAWSDDLSIEKIKGISYSSSDGSVITTERRQPICDLDKLPILDFGLLAEMGRPLTIAPFERTRGCNYRCEFCIVNDRFGPSRSASPERVAAELEVRIESGFRHFFCIDDNFTQGRQATLRLLSLMQDIARRRGVKLDITVQVRSSVGRDEELMRAMWAAGIRVLCIGLESPIREELEGMKKRQTPEQIESEVRNLRRHGFMIHGMFIFGYPLETAGADAMLTLRERADRYIDFIRRTAIDTIQVLKPVPVPGSRLAKRLMDQGRIIPLKLVGWDKYDGNFLTFLPDREISASELQTQANRIMRNFYHPFSFLKFPVLVFTTPVEILRMGFTGAARFARNRADRTQAAIKDGVERASALREGFREAGEEVSRVWRNARMRTLGSMVVTNWLKLGPHAKFLETLSKLQSPVKIGGDKAQS